VQNHVSSIDEVGTVMGVFEELEVGRWITGEFFDTFAADRRSPFPDNRDDRATARTCRPLQLRFASIIEKSNQIKKNEAKLELIKGGNLEGENLLSVGCGNTWASH
jgi:hypothetical protein